VSVNKAPSSSLTLDIAHAKGILLEGTFTPTPEAKELTKAYHFNNTVPVTVRFSNSTGIPVIPDNDANAGPRGFAVRFHLPEKDGKRQHTDIIGHSTPFFPVPNGQEFANLLKAIGASQQPDLPHPTPIEQYLGGHPAALAFVTAPKPFPHSFGTEPYFALTAYKFINAEGKETYVRWEVFPEAGLEHYGEEEAKALGANYLSDEITERVAKGPVSFKILAQIAEEGDEVNDTTVKWPESRRKVELGTVKLTSVAADQAATQKTTIFDPEQRVEGVENSNDPLIAFRAALYLISGRERRAA
jgi:catalase